MNRFRHPNHGRFSRGTVAGFAAATDLAAAAFFAYGVLVRTESTTDSLIVSDGVTGYACLLGSTDDTLVASETLDSFYAVSTVDIGIALDVIASRLTIAGICDDRLIAGDTVAAGLTGVSADTVVLGDSLATAVTTTAADKVVVTDVATAQSVVSAISIDTLIVRDDIGYGFIQSAADSLVAIDNIAGVVAVASPVLTDTILVGEVLAGPVAVYAALPADTVVSSGTLAGTLALVGVLSDTVLFGDALSDAERQIVVVVNAETGAVSTYTMTPTATDLVEYGGTLYLAGPTGLYAMDATDDDDGKVIWTLRTGFSNLGSDLLKRVRDVNVQGRTVGGLTVQAITDRNGLKQEHNYLLPALTRDSYRDGVVKVGKGWNSVYWALGMRGEGPAEIDQLRVAVEPLSRRR